MATIWGVRKGEFIIPYMKFRAAAEKFAEGERLRITIDRDRNGKFSALFHVMLGRLAEAINKGPAQTDIDALKKWVKLRKGWYEVVALPAPALDGTTHAIDYKSTSFSKMGEDEFHAFCLDACELIKAELAPWIAGSAEWEEVRSIINTILPATPEDAV